MRDRWKFYCDMLGARAVGDDRKAVAERGVDSRTVGIAMGFGGMPEWRATYIHFAEGEQATVIDLLQWIEPASTGKPYDRLNRIGIPRIALAVDDIDKTYNLRHSSLGYRPPAPEAIVPVTLT